MKVMEGPLMLWSNYYNRCFSGLAINMNKSMSNYISKTKLTESTLANYIELGEKR
jgi:hypothetical protein